ncbi:MAG TPA: hypothetical protein VI479_09140 [Blastocatellia bacterium]
MPNWNHIVRQHLAALRLSPEREIEIVEELSLHMEAAYEGALADGLSEADAGDLALVDMLRRDQFGLLIFVGQRFERELVAINRLLPALFDIANKFLSFPILKEPSDGSQALATIDRP